MPAGPCLLCGAKDYPMSLGGPAICPRCDCGNFPDPAEATKRMLGLKPPVTETENWGYRLAALEILALAVGPVLEEMKASNGTCTMGSWAKLADAYDMVQTYVRPVGSRG